MKEIWKDVKGYEGLYKISNYGKVVGYKHNKTLKPLQAFGRDKKTPIRLSVILSKCGVVKAKSLHILVYNHFIGSINGILDFKDGDFTNCRVDNLIDVERTHSQRINYDVRVLNKVTGEYFTTFKSFTKHLGLTVYSAKKLIDSGKSDYEII